MWRDPIVEEVRKTREEILGRFGNDLGKYVDYLRAKRKKPKRRKVRPTARGRRPSTASRAKRKRAA
jgi:hypothetical protein